MELMYHDGTRSKVVLNPDLSGFQLSIRHLFSSGTSEGEEYHFTVRVLGLSYTSPCVPPHPRTHLPALLHRIASEYLLWFVVATESGTAFGLPTLHGAHIVPDSKEKMGHGMRFSLLPMKNELTKQLLKCVTFPLQKFTFLCRIPCHVPLPITYLPLIISVSHSPP